MNATKTATKTAKKPMTEEQKAARKEQAAARKAKKWEDRMWLERCAQACGCYDY